MPSLGWQELVILLILYSLYSIPAAAVVIGAMNSKGRRKPYVSSKKTSLSAIKVIQSAVQKYPAHGYQISNQNEQNVTFTKKPRPNTRILILMFIAGILPVIAYWVLSTRQFVVNITASTQGDGTLVNVESSVTGFGAQETDDKFLSSLPTGDAISYESV